MGRLERLDLLVRRARMEPMVQMEPLVRLARLGLLEQLERKGRLGLRARTGQMAQLVLLGLPEQPPDLELQLLRLAR